MSVGAAATAAMQQATRTVPTVFVLLPDPVGAGVVESLARPGGNATGFMPYEFGMSAKWVELLKQIAPEITRVGVIRDPLSPPKSASSLQSNLWHPVAEWSEPDRRADAAEIERAITAFAQLPNGGLIVTGSTGAAVHHKLIVTLAARHGYLRSTSVGFGLRRRA